MTGDEPVDLFDGQHQWKRARVAAGLVNAGIRVLQTRPIEELPGLFDGPEWRERLPYWPMSQD